MKRDLFILVGKTRRVVDALIRIGGPQTRAPRCLRRLRRASLLLPPVSLHLSHSLPQGWKEQPPHLTRHMACDSLCNREEMQMNK